MTRIISAEEPPSSDTGKTYTVFSGKEEQNALQPEPPDMTSNCESENGAAMNVRRFALSFAFNIIIILLAGVFKMSSVEIAEELRRSLPGTDEILIQYLSGYLVDDAAEDEDVIEIAKTFLVSIAGKERQSTVDLLLARIQEMLSDQLSAREHRRNQPKLTKLDKVLDMSKTTMLSTLSLGEAGVDLESINKGK